MGTGLGSGQEVVKSTKCVVCGSLLVKVSCTYIHTVAASAVMQEKRYTNLNVRISHLLRWVIIGRDGTFHVNLCGDRIQEENKITKSNRPIAHFEGLFT